MAVRADHLALLGLVQHGPPAPMGQVLTDVEGLVAQVVELEHERVPHPAVNAWVAGEVLEEQPRSFDSHRSLADRVLGDAPLPVRGVVGASVLPATRLCST